MIDSLHARPNRHKHLGRPLVEDPLLELFVRFVFKLLIARLLNG